MRANAAVYGLAPSVAAATEAPRVGATATDRAAAWAAHAPVWGDTGGVIVTISSTARLLGGESDTNPRVAVPGADAPNKPVTTTGTPQKLSQEDAASVDKLKQRDREVRAHEQAHKAVGGGLAGAVNLTLEQGPDGKSYAVGGRVPIDVTPIKGDPSATIRKMQKVQAAAMAPADPSGADQQVAAAAAAYMAEAMQELSKSPITGSSGSQKPGSVGAKLKAVG